ncbi:hypothetical protein TARUN_2189 [Trichoderma arundinaceum]|uniref:Retrovirus-related Pol polyprotein from transposon TNT 1-94-like beta-barrel domain-containing protein n=1 Tax=Trichoderma arundinaceum TaxID=490622 RepID=A0A395NX48_TRIAR|nr:hypothetical protein TARUN_2189 [Trichoderma arundinaceum]
MSSTAILDEKLFGEIDCSKLRALPSTFMVWQNSSEGLSADWVFSNNSNVHVCNDKKWFAELTLFSSTASAILGSEQIPVEGVGSVDLPVKRSPNLSGPKAHHVLHLTNVLYIPSSVCNLVCWPIFKSVAEVDFSATSKSSGSLKDADGRPVAYFAPFQERQLPCIKISGPPVGPRLAPSIFKPIMRTLSGMAIDHDDSHDEEEEEEEEEYGEYPPSRLSHHMSSHHFNIRELDWIEEHWGSIEAFMICHGLKFYKDEDCEEARAILRAVMVDDDDDDDDNDNADDNDGDDDFENWNPDNHLADHHFSAKELGWIKKNYQDSATFMFTFGLKFYDDEDCAEAKNLVLSFLSE